MKLLLEKGADLETKDNIWSDAAVVGCREGHEAVVKLLLDKGAELEAKDDKYGRTPLSWAARERARGGREAAAGAKALSSRPRITNGRTPLSWAAENGHEAVVKLLLEKGAELEAKDEYGRTPLSWAAGNGHEAVVKLLLEKGADARVQR